MEFKELKLKEFLSDLSSDKPSPGGGSVAALLAAISGSLNSMVYSLTVNKKAFEKLSSDDKKKVLDYNEASKKFINKSMTFMEKDREEFTKLMECYKMPKETEEEQKIRDKEIKQKTLKAMEVPLNLAKEAYEFYDNIDIALKYGNKMLASDAACAASLLHAAIETAIINVKVNLNNFKNESFFKEIQLDIENLEFNSFSRKNIVCNMAEEIYYPE